jgi:MFS family permease
MCGAAGLHCDFPGWKDGPRKDKERGMVRRITTKLPYPLGFLIAVGPVATDMYLPAFPQIAKDLHDTAAPQYSLASYFLGPAIGQMTQGALSDRWGRRGLADATAKPMGLIMLGCAITALLAALARPRLNFAPAE